MSNALAIAAVTAVLKDLLNDGVINNNISGAVGGSVTVTALPPDRVFPPNAAEGNQLNIFLYQMTPNQGWRNAGLPSRNHAGQRLSNPPLALDLHYLLTAYGSDDLHSEILLGYAMQLLHETPVLAREEIRKALDPSPLDTLGLPPAKRYLSASDLADQVEQIKITPTPLTVEEISKLWSVFNSRYRTTAAYQVSVVLIEASEPKKTPLPVLTRGPVDNQKEPKREQGIIAQVGLTPAIPTIEQIKPPNSQPAVRMGETLTLCGHHLDGVVAVRFTHVRSKDALELAVTADSTATEVRVQIPHDLTPGQPVPATSPSNPDNWQIGVYNLAAVIRRTGKLDRTTNELPVAVAPMIKNIDVVSNAGVVTVTCVPNVWKTQQISLVVGEQDIAAEPLKTDSNGKADKVSFKSSSLTAGVHLVRLRVDGIESLLIDRSKTPPEFDDSQKVTIP